MIAAVARIGAVMRFGCTSGDYWLCALSSEADGERAKFPSTAHSARNLAATRVTWQGWRTLAEHEMVERDLRGYMRILHTGDWHIGQTLSGFDRAHEFHAVLTQLAAIVVAREIDALVVAGDVFDTQNPSGAAQQLLYDALVALNRARPSLQIIMTAGNHDAAGRLEAPSGLLAAIGTRVVGNIRRVDGKLEARRHLLPLVRPGTSQGTPDVVAHVLAVSYPTPACLPNVTTVDAATSGGSPIVQATRALYADLIDGVRPALAGLPLIVTGHLHVAGGLESEGPSERRILVGGEHAVPPDVFPAEATYVALGHLHREQRVGPPTVRYCGSLLPLSATELGYNHSVTLVTLDGLAVPTIEKIELRRPVPFWRLPDKAGVKLSDLGDHLAALVAAHGVAADLPQHLHPYVQVWIDRDGVKPNYRAEVDAIAEAFPVRLVDPRLTPLVAGTAVAADSAAGERLSELVPEDLFRRAFERANSGAVPSPAHLAAFHQVAVDEAA
jgi:DNA repair protein SbcD/Mre11